MCVQSCPTLCNPMDCSPPGSSVHGISQSILEWVAMPSSRESTSPALPGGFFQFNSVQLLSHVRLFVTPWTAARQSSLSITNSQSLLKLMSIELVMPSIHLILCHPLLLPSSIFPSIRVFSKESVLCIRWSKYCFLPLTLIPG